MGRKAIPRPTAVYGRTGPVVPFGAGSLSTEARVHYDALQRAKQDPTANMTPDEFWIAALMEMQNELLISNEDSAVLWWRQEKG